MPTVIPKSNTFCFVETPISTKVVSTLDSNSLLWTCIAGWPKMPLTGLSLLTHIFTLDDGAILISEPPKVPILIKPSSVISNTKKPISSQCASNNTVLSGSPVDSPSKIA